ncbi:MAG TPA: YkgJ family cysteine cluster protein [Thermoleophilia bacterium]|nr:YkgJ family cysteine cluster protein [Thermoleophilia bacterium]
MRAEPAFHCTSCGLCCRRELSRGSLPDSFFREDGWCRHLLPDMRCGIYAERPLACRVDDAWRLTPELARARTGAETLEEFHAVLYRGCEKLQADEH